MIKHIKITILLFSSLFMVSCKNETVDKVKKAKQDVSNVSSVISNAKEAQEDAASLRELEPLSNEDLKTWLPESIDGLRRTGFKVGKNGYMNVASIHGTFKKENTEKELKIEVIDGAGPTASMLMMGFSMNSNMDVEEEDEYKHLKTVSHNGIKAQQTYYKQRNDTKIEFLYNKRFGIMVSTKEMNPEQTWDLIEKFDLNNLKEK